MHEPPPFSKHEIWLRHLHVVLQECVKDPVPAVAALGLQTLTLMCAVDVLDFYKAWKLVRAWVPQLPDHPQMAAAWVSLLACGALDAPAYPHKAEAILELLWTAVKHSKPQVCEVIGAVSEF